MKKTAIILLLTLLVVLLGACRVQDTTLVTLGRYTYSDSDRYTAGSASIHETVTAIDVNWVDGLVRVAYHDGDGITLSETADKALSGDTELRWRVKDQTLVVKYAASGYRHSQTLNKQLTLLLPRDLQMDSIEVSTASSGILADGLAADSIRLTTASGSIVLTQQGQCGEVAVDTASGDVTLTLNAADKVNLNTVSGNVLLNARQAAAVTANAVSGDLSLQFAIAPERITADSVSGDVTVALPEDAGFTADVNTVSGSVRGDQSMTRRGDRYSCGDGRCSIKAATVSGDVTFAVTAP